MAGAAAVLAAGGCGGSSTTSSASSSSASGSGSSAVASAPAVDLSADPSGALKFTASHATAKAGQVTLKMANPAPLPHGIAIQGPGVDKVGAVVQKRGTSTVTADLKPGTYTFYCPVPGHRQGGMAGTLTVK